MYLKTNHLATKFLLTNKIINAVVCFLLMVKIFSCFTSNYKINAVFAHFYIVTEPIEPIHSSTYL